MNLYTLIPNLLFRIISILQASTLRDRYYHALQRIEILETALEDIQRISASRSDVSERHRLIQNIIKNTQSTQQ